MAKNNSLGLGRGLGALIDTETISTNGSTSINEVEISLIIPNPHQPRTHFDEEALAELATSIKELGVISPITLRMNDDGTYLIIAGERRYRASKLLGFKTIPAYVKSAADEQVMEMALIENIQREDLNAIEIALTFYRLMEEYKLTQERLSERVGKKRTTIANYLRLLRLPADIQMGLKDKKIDMGHARAILSVNDPAIQLYLYEQVLRSSISVRKVEELVKMYNETGSFEPTQATPKTNEPKANPVVELKEYDELKSQLSNMFGTKVQFALSSEGKGKISIPFKSDEELARIMEMLDRIGQ